MNALETFNRFYENLHKNEKAFVPAKLTPKKDESKKVNKPKGNILFLYKC